MPSSSTAPEGPSSLPSDLREGYAEIGDQRLHYVEAGEGPLVVLLHGFPETWYSWRHQLAALAEAGYRAVAPDQRGYGQTDRPAEPDRYTMLHLVGDVIGLIDALGEAQAVVVGHDWGAPVAWNAALMRPDRFPAVVGMSVPYAPRGKISLIDVLRKNGLNDFYMMYFQEPGVAEREFERDVTASLRRVLYSASGSRPEGTNWKAFAAPGGEWVKLLDSAEPRWQGSGPVLPDRCECGGEMTLTSAARSVGVYHLGRPL